MGFTAPSSDIDGSSLVSVPQQAQGFAVPASDSGISIPSATPQPPPFNPDRSWAQYLAQRGTDALSAGTGDAMNLVQGAMHYPARELGMGSSFENDYPSMIHSAIDKSTGGYTDDSKDPGLDKKILSFIAGNAPLGGVDSIMAGGTRLAGELGGVGAYGLAQKYYPDSRLLSILAPLVGNVAGSGVAGFAKSPVVPEVAKAVETSGINVPPAFTMNSDALKGAQDYFANAWFSNPAFKQQMANASPDAINSMKSVISSASPLDAAGNVVSTAEENSANNEANYGSFFNHPDSATPMPLTSSLAKADDILSKLNKGTLSSEGGLNTTNPDKQFVINELNKFKANVGDSGQAPAAAVELYKQDLNSNFSKLQDSGVKSLLNTFNNAVGEDQAAFAQSHPQAGQILQHAKDDVTAWKSSQALDDILRNKLTNENGSFSFGKAASALNPAKDAGGALYENLTPQDQAKLAAIQKVSSAVKNSQALGNPSGTTNKGLNILSVLSPMVAPLNFLGSSAMMSPALTNFTARAIQGGGGALNGLGGGTIDPDVLRRMGVAGLNSQDLNK